MKTEERRNLKLKEHILWMDNKDTICCGNGDGSYFGSLDLNENKSKWREIQEYPSMDVSAIELM